MKYDAFISYRHGGLDGRVAEKLHKLLETYRIPPAIAKRIGKKRLSRIFRDREELPTSANLSDSINDALENSSYLLLVCSRRTNGSRWVMREIERFGELHGKDKIITLLIDGEPEESFPPGLQERQVNGETIFVEPLAADIRAETAAKSLKILSEEKLRLLAPILGCGYDDLRRRHRRRKIQKVAASVAAAFAIVLAFSVFALTQYVQIQKQMQLKLENQSYVLAEYSRAALAAGDPDTALLLALEALPQSLAKPERPLVAEVEMALSDALMVYNTGDEFKPHKSVALPSSPGKIVLSPDERYAAALCLYELVLIDTETGELIKTLPTMHSAVNDAVFLDNGVIAYTSADGLAAYDIAADSRLWLQRPATRLALSSDGATLAAVNADEARAYLYSTDGTDLTSVNFNGSKLRIPIAEAFYNPNNTLFELNADGSRLAVSFDDGSLSIANTTLGSISTINTADPSAIYNGGFFGDYLAYAVTVPAPLSSKFNVYYVSTDSTFGLESSSQFIPYIADEGILFAVGGEVFAFLPETQQTRHVYSAGGTIEALATANDVLLACDSRGAYRFVSHTTTSYSSDYVCNFADLGATYAITAGYNSKAIRILKRGTSAGKALFEYDTTYQFSEARVHNATERAVFFSYRGMRSCDLDGNIVGEVEFPEPMSVKDTLYAADTGNVLVIYDNALLIYSCLDASLVQEVRGKTGERSVIKSPHGVYILTPDGTVALYAADEALSGAAGATAKRAIVTEFGVITMAGNGVYENGALFVQGDVVGVGKDTNGDVLFAVSDDVIGHVFAVREKGGTTKLFTFDVRGRCEVFFTGGYVFVSPLAGDAMALDMTGKLVRTFAETAFLAEVTTAGDLIAASFAAGANTRFSYLLKPETLDTAAYLPGYLGTTEDGKLILNSGTALETVELLPTSELAQAARERLGSRVLTADERSRYKAW